MSKASMGRWDVGEVPSGGAYHPYCMVGFIGTNFALRFDRRWEFMCLWRWERQGGEDETLFPWPEAAVRFDSWGEEVPYRTQKRMVHNELKQVEGEGGVANWWYTWIHSQPHSVGSILHARPSRYAAEAPSERLRNGLRLALECLRDGRTPNEYERAVWLVEGCVRWADEVPENVMAVIELANSANPEPIFNELLSDVKKKRMESAIESAIYDVRLELESVGWAGPLKS